MEIETDKTTVGVPSPSHGIIEEIFVADGDTVKAGQQLFRLKVTGEAPSKPAAETKPAAAQAQPMKPVSAPPTPVQQAPPAVNIKLLLKFLVINMDLALICRLLLHHQLRLLQRLLRLHPNQRRPQQRFRLLPFVMPSRSMLPLLNCRRQTTRKKSREHVQNNVLK